MISDYELVLKCTKSIQSLLEEQYQANGRGLGEKATSIIGKISPVTYKKIMFLSTIRNKLLHEENYNLDGNTRSSFISTFNFCANELGIKPLDLSDITNNRGEKNNENKKTAVLWQDKKKKMVQNNLKMIYGFIAILFVSLIFIIGKR